eukprot:scaffold15986_cov142-Isochrysis_galbana.AAC.1
MRAAPMRPPRTQGWEKETRRREPPKNRERESLRAAPAHPPRTQGWAKQNPKKELKNRTAHLSVPHLRVLLVHRLAHECTHVRIRTDVSVGFVRLLRARTIAGWRIRQLPPARIKLVDLFQGGLELEALFRVLRLTKVGPEVDPLLPRFVVRVVVC